MWRICIIAPIVLVVVDARALEQNLGASSNNIFSIAPNMNPRHMSPTGKPCLAMDGYARAEVMNNKIFEHWIAATNSCGMRIKVKVCYFKTDDCIVLDVAPYGRKDSIIGIYPMLSSFKYEAKEQF